METPGRRNQERILVLDEHDADREKTVAAVGEVLPLAIVTSVTTADQFRSVIGTQPFDIVVLDQILSSTDGVELIHELRLKEWDPAILVVSTSKDPKHVADAYNAGCHRYVVKSGEWCDDLVPALRHLLRVKRLEEENARLVAKLTEANALLSEKNRRLDEFSGTVAHDIRGPLGAIHMKLEYMRDIYADDFDERLNKIVDGTLDSTRRLIGVVQAMYEFAKLGSKASKLQEIDLATFVEEVINDLSFDDRLDIQIGIGELPNVWGSVWLLRKVFQNLISNAVKYSDKRTTVINIQCTGVIRRSLGEFAVIRVEDNGPGIAIDEQADVFTMFRRGSNVGEHEGIGIGLAVVKRIIELHYGSIELESQPGVGTAFVFTLPTEEIVLA